MSSNKGKATTGSQAPRIEYSGFKEMNEMDMVQVRKESELFAEKVSAHGMPFTLLSVRLKSVHKVGNSQKYEVHVQVTGSKQTRSAERTDKNPFKALDLSFKTLLTELQKGR